MDISEAHLKQAVEQGHRVLRVVVVALSTTGDLLPWFRLSGHQQYSRLVTRKYEGPKSFRDFRTLRRTISEVDYHGGIFIYPEGHPFLQRILG